MPDFPPTDLPHPRASRLAKPSDRSSSRPRLRLVLGLRLGLSLGVGMGLVLGMLMLPGCKMEVISEKSGWDWLLDNPRLTLEDGGNGRSQRSGKGQTSLAQRLSDNKQMTTWAVKVAEYQGPYRHENATQLSARLSSQTNLSELWVVDENQTATLYCGRFRDPSSESAQAALETIKTLNLANAPQLADADLYPINGGDGQGHSAGDPWDLSQYPGRYALQIAVFTQQYVQDNMDAAETAEQMTKVLREDGFPAFYYHGQNSSAVCLGAMTRDQAWEEKLEPPDYKILTEVYSQPVELLRVHFPTLAVDGLSQNVMRDGQVAGQVPTRLIQVPAQRRAAPGN